MQDNNTEGERKEKFILKLILCEVEFDIRV